MSNSSFDAQAFYSALDAERNARDKTWKQVAAEAKVSASTLTRMGQGKRPDVDSLATLANWSGLDVDQFILGSRNAERPSSETLNEITSLLRADRNLKSGGAETLEAIIKSAYAHLKKVPK
jgi:transcriptional regulator with XRE-family HTH domain